MGVFGFLVNDKKLVQVMRSRSDREGVCGTMLGKKMRERHGLDERQEPRV